MKANNIILRKSLLLATAFLLATAVLLVFTPSTANALMRSSDVVIVNDDWESHSTGDIIMYEGMRLVYGVNATSSISEALSLVRPGGVIHIESGTYTSASSIVVSKENVRLIGDENEKPLVNFTGSALGFSVSASGVVIENLNITGGSYAIIVSAIGSSSTGEGEPTIIRDVQVKNNVIFNAGYYGVYIAAQNNGIVENMSFTGNTLLNSKAEVYAYPYSSVNNLVFANNSLANTEVGNEVLSISVYVHSNLTNTVFSNNVLRETLSPGNSAEDELAYIYFNGNAFVENLFLENNTITGATDNGIYFTASTSTIRNLVFRDNIINNIAVSGIVMYLTENHEVNGIAFTNNTISSVGGDGVNFWVRGTVEDQGPVPAIIRNVVLANNTVHDTGWSGLDVYASVYGGIDNIVFTGNNLYNNQGYEGIWLTSYITRLGGEHAGYYGNATITNVVINNNNARNNGESGIMLMSMGNGTISNITISNNIATSNTEDGISFQVSGGANITNATITNNTVRDNSDAGFEITSDAGNPGFINNLTLTQNNITSNSIGVNVGNSTLEAHNNNIEDNNAYGLKVNRNSEPVNATSNWWGASTGPYHPTLNPSGEGDAVSDNVLINPWLHEPFIAEETETSGENQENNSSQNPPQEPPHHETFKKLSPGERRALNKAIQTLSSLPGEVHVLNGTAREKVVEAFEEMLAQGLYKTAPPHISGTSKKMLKAVLERIYGEGLVNYPIAEGRLYLLYWLYSSD